MSGKTTPQSGIAFDDDPELLFDYNQRLFEVACSVQPRSMLLIGGGAFTLPAAVVQRLPKATVDAVEIDPLLPELAREYFGLPDSPRLRVITQDGREYVNASNGTYDLIVIDAFSEYAIPLSLLTVEAAAQYARLLSPGGVVALNVIATYRGSIPSIAHRIIASLGEHFATVEVYPADPHDSQGDSQNLIIVASQQESIHLDYLQSVRVQPAEFEGSRLLMRDEG